MASKQALAKDGQKQTLKPGKRTPNVECKVDDLQAVCKRLDGERKKIRKTLLNGLGELPWPQAFVSGSCFRTRQR